MITAISQTTLNQQNHARLGLWSARCLAVLLLGIALATCSLHPYWGTYLAALSLVFFAISAYWPARFFVAFPVLLVAADGYLLTGQMVVQEYDPLLLASFAGGLWNGFWIGHSKISRPLLWFGAIFVISLVVSGYRGVTLLPETDFRDQLSVYFSSWNVLRITKGYLWGAAFVLMLLGSTLDRDKAVHGLVLGFQLASLYVGLFVLAERLVFESLWDFSRVMRATGPFATMHIGDQHLDGFLALALPMVWYGALRGGLAGWGQSRETRCSGISTSYTEAFGDLRDDRFRWIRYVWPGVLSALIMHAGLSSMSRATIVVLLAQLFVLAFAGGAVLAGARGRDWLKGAMLIIGIGLGLMIAGASLAIRSEAISTRFESSRSDLLVRWRHWRMCIGLAQDRTASLVFGKGLGTLPSVLAEASGRPTPPIRWQSDVDGNGGRVIIHPGWPIYLEHWMFLPDRGAVDLTLVATAPTATTRDPAIVTISRCSKALLQAYACNAENRVIPASTSQQILASLDVPLSGGGKSGGLSSWRPQSLALYADGDRPVELQRVQIDFGKLARRSSVPDDFTRGVSGWSFTCDDHLAWRAKNIWVHLLFEQGWLGLLAAIGFQLGVAYHLVRGAGWHGFDRAAVATSLIGFAAVGCFGTLIDTPWLAAITFSIVAIIGVSAANDRAFHQLG